MKRVTVRHILVAQSYEASDILRKLEAGESFEQLAKDFSTCPSNAEGGMLGEFGRGQMVREFEKAAFSLFPGMVSGVVRTQFGYHIIKREK